MSGFRGWVWGASHESFLWLDDEAAQTGWSEQNCVVAQSCRGEAHSEGAGRARPALSPVAEGFCTLPLPAPGSPRHSVA